uniref:Gypsy retrotransposon integrase-like protein 1 n=1 Tax=Astyanax mexicanus TaxID=7994 RepID=A0A3B1J0P6_ASTMX
MASFNLEAFVALPSLEVFERCRKDDLRAIAAHYGIQVAKQAVKKELRDKILAALRVLRVLEGPSPADSSSPKVCEGVEGAVTPTASVSKEQVRPDADVQATLPRFDPSFSSLSAGSHDEARARVRITRLQLEAEEKAQARQAELELKLAIRKLELEVDREVRLREVELQAMKVASVSPVQLDIAPTPSSPQATFPAESSVASAPAPIATPFSPPAFDVSKHISLVPPFRETEVDTYFGVFERIATALNWPKGVWSLLLQCRLVGKAQEVCSSLPLEDSLQYDSVKAAILRAYELVPEAYRQKFRMHKKSSSQTFVEFAREKEILFDKWCSACKATDFASLRKLILLEEFKNCLPEQVVTYLNEHKVSSLSEGAVLADEYILTHKISFKPVKVYPPVVPYRRAKPNPSGRVSDECFYCHKPGHVIANCQKLKGKQEKSHHNTSQNHSVALVDTNVSGSLTASLNATDPSYQPFITQGTVSLQGDEQIQYPVSILRDTGATQSFILADVLPLSDQTFCGSYVLCRGIAMQYVKVPLHCVRLTSGLATGVFTVGVCPSLPVEGVTFIMGNDIAGGKVLPVLEVVDSPIQSVLPDVTKSNSSIFPACVVTRAKARLLEDDVDLSDSFLASDLSTCPYVVTPQIVGKKDSVQSSSVDKVVSNLAVSRDQLIESQNSDPSLRKCFSGLSSADNMEGKQVAYFKDKDVLMRKWSPHTTTEAANVYQIVVPDVFRQHVLRLAHDHPWSGHLGITKTYARILKHFFWPGLRKDVVEFCRSCHVCQTTGKPNQVIPPAPLCPIPAIGEPFERVLVDCVGPLPKTKSGNQYLLTIMCAATRFPEAIPLRKITTPVVVRALIKYFTTFGLPKVVQSDQGTNFLSKLFAQVMATLNITHQVSSPYHPESQGALERFHQSLKSMLRKYCLDTGKEWDEGVPLVLFAVREAVQESLGFSPAQLVFAHSVRGPLKVLKERFLNDTAKPQNILDYVSTFRERLHKACALAHETLSVSQERMKHFYDKRAVSREFQPGDRVMVLLPVSGSSLSAKFSGPYVVDEKLSDTDYVICTPDRKRKKRVCHVNMLKAYHTRDNSVNESRVPNSTMASVGLLTASPDSTVVADKTETCVHSQVSCRLPNSEILQDLSNILGHLTENQRADVEELIQKFPSIFHDVPSQTSVVMHDVQVIATTPIKQHAYRLNAAKRAAMKKEVDYLLENGLAKPSCSPWSSPCILVPKPDGTFRLCTDYRRVNSVTISDSYPLPRIDDCVDSVGSAQFVSKLDLLKGYWQVPLTSRASDISAFVTPDAFVQYTVMPFGFKNAPATFQRLVNTVLSNVPNCSCYLDDLVIYTSDWPTHIKTIATVFKRLEQATLTLNLAKCEFARATVTYLGKIVGQGQVRPVDAQVSAIVSYPTPTTRRELRRFLGMAGYYRTFCRNFSTVVTPLTSLLSPNKAFVWDFNCQHAFENVKALLCSTPVLAAPNFSTPFKLEVDASAVGAGAVLLQEDESGVEHPVCYFSRKFNKHQVNYSTIEKETLALMLSLQHFDVYVGSSCFPVIVYTDHNPLVFLSRMYNHNQRLMRWSLMLQEYNLEIRHKKGSENVIADALSRI